MTSERGLTSMPSRERCSRRSRRAPRTRGTSRSSAAGPPAWASPSMPPPAGTRRLLLEQQRLRQRHLQPQHQAGARRRALPRAGQHLAGDGGAEGARAAAQNAPHLVTTCRSSCRTTSGGKRPFYGIGLKVYDLLAGKYGFGDRRILSREETLRRLPTSRPTACAAASSTTTASSTTRGC